MATTNNGGKTLVVLLGATATGKTDVGIALARAFGSEIVSSDSRQIYREMSIGTAKPTEEELSAVPHHLIGTRSVREDYSAGRYEQDTKRARFRFAFPQAAVRSAALQAYFQCADHSLRVAAVHDFAMRRIELPQFFEQRLESFGLRPADECFPQMRIDGRKLVHAVADRVDVQARPADQKQGVVLAETFLQHPKRILLEPAWGVGLAYAASAQKRVPI